MPTLNLSSAAAPAGLPSLLAVSPIAPVPTGDGASDAFATMLAGLTAMPGEGATPAPVTMPVATASLPQVRQDPAVWLPDEDAAAPDAGSGGPGLNLTKLDGRLVMPPDCEMPAFDPAPPVTAQPKPPVPGEMPADLVTPRFMPLRLGAAPAPTRFTVAATESDRPNESAEREEAPDTDLAMPAAPPAHVTTQVAMPVTMLADRADPVSSQPSAATPVQISSAQTAPDGRPQQQPQGQPQPQPQALPVDAAVEIAPEMLKQVAQAIDASRASGETAVHAEIASSPAPVASPAPVLAPAPAQPVTAPAPPQFTPVDTGRAEWVQAMIDRIAELPQSEGKREAQISLLPAALGKVDVSIIERDEQIQVTLTAETVQARQLLAEAAPRLQDMAEARGLRLAEPQVGGGQPQDRRGAQDQQQPQTPARPRPASAAADIENQPDGDLIA